MTYFTKSAGDTLRASQVNAMLQQGIPTFADTTARDAAITAPSEGMHAFTTGTRIRYLYTNGAWAIDQEPKQSWTPTVSQPGSINKTVNWGWYKRSNGIYWADCKLSITASGTGGNAITVSTPFTHIDAGGKFRVFDTSGSVYREGSIQPQSTTLYSFIIDSGAAEYGIAGTDGLTNGDVLWLTVQGSY